MRSEISIYLVNAAFHINMNIFTNDIHFSNRTVIRKNIRTILFLLKLKNWTLKIEISLKFIAETDEHRFFALKLLYHYQHLNEKDFINLFCTDFIVHKIKLKFETEPYNLFQIRWFAHKKWWFRKLISDELKNGIYEHIDSKNERLFKWNSKAVLIDKIENSFSSNESRLIFDYFCFHENLFEIYVELFFRIHDNLFNSEHECLFSVDLKHAYFTINLNEKAKFLFAFIISEMNQFQFIRMSQNSKSVSFIMIEIINRTFDEISNEFFLFHFSDQFQFFNFCFYMNDFFENQFLNFFFLYQYFRYHFFSRLKWVRLKLFFKKLRLWCIKIKILKIIHEIDDKIHVLKNKIRKIIEFFEFRNAINICEFLNVLEIIRKWVKNFFEIIKSLFKLTEKTVWKWKFNEQFSFELLKLKAESVIFMHKINFSDFIYFYIDAFEYEKKLVIIQKRIENFEISHFKKISVLYDLIIFISLQKKYVIYKRELCAMIKLIMKYDYLAKHFYNIIVIHIDHKFLTHFFIFIKNNHENIYEHWTKQFRKLNDEIKYISKSKNKMTDELFRIFFHSVDCEKRFKVKKCFDQLKKWIWSDRKKIEYEHLLAGLTLSKRNEILKHETFHEKSVFVIEITNIKENSTWISAYVFSYWYKNEKKWKFYFWNSSENHVLQN